MLPYYLYLHWQPSQCRGGGPCSHCRITVVARQPQGLGLPLWVASLYSWWVRGYLLPRQVHKYCTCLQRDLIRSRSGDLNPGLPGTKQPLYHLSHHPLIIVVSRVSWHLQIMVIYYDVLNGNYVVQVRVLTTMILLRQRNMQVKGRWHGQIV